jgi:glyoxylase-like metal-dependent hydrolase (beta-lactamase superfamily II)
VFGDGSIVILSTPGHTPGHQSLLVKLPKTGPIVLSGDAAHFMDNWENRRVPEGNVDKDKTLASMQRIADTLSKEHAQLWINHDKAGHPVSMSTACLICGELRRTNCHSELSTITIISRSTTGFTRVLA